MKLYFKIIIDMREFMIFNRLLILLLEICIITFVSLSQFYHAYYLFTNVFFYNLNNDLIELRLEILSPFLHFYL